MTYLADLERTRERCDICRHPLSEHRPTCGVRSAATDFVERCGCPSAPERVETP